MRALRPLHRGRTGPGAGGEAVRVGGVSLLLLGSLLAAACPHSPPPRRAAPAPPTPAGTICERPPRPAPAAADPAVEASFRAFARDWLARLRQAGGTRQIHDEFEVELRPTRSPQAPWVGILRYCAQAVRCPSCRAHSEAVSEIFRYQAGEWIY